MPHVAQPARTSPDGSGSVPAPTRAHREVGRKRVASTFSSVVLPAPLGPSKATRSPQATRSRTPRRAGAGAELLPQPLHLHRPPLAVHGSTSPAPGGAASSARVRTRSRCWR